MTSLGKGLFTQVAKEYLAARPPVTNETAYAVWLHMVYITANVFATRAPLFDKARFLLAAGAPPL